MHSKFIFNGFVFVYASKKSFPNIFWFSITNLRYFLDNVTQEKRAIPWRHILTSAPVWALVAAQIGHDWGFFTMVTDLPKYMKEVLKFNVTQNGLWSALPYVVMWIVSMSSGWLCDYLIQNKYMTTGFARKFFTAIGKFPGFSLYLTKKGTDCLAFPLPCSIFSASIGPGIFIIVASYTGCDRMLAVGMFTIAMGFMGTFYCGMKVNGLDICPNYAGTVMAIVNGIGAVSGIITPYIVSALTEDVSFEF